MKHYQLQIEFLSPVHLGSGTILDPMTYFIANGRLVLLALDRYLLNTTDEQRDQFESIIEKGDLKGLRMFAQTRIDSQLYARFSINVSPKVEALFAGKLESVENQLLINPLLRSADNPVVPGSAIKGAIRTAIVSQLAGELKPPMPRKPREEREFESKVLGYRNARTDPFRALKISDGQLDKEDTIVRQIFNVSRKEPDRIRSIQMLFETTESTINGMDVKTNHRFVMDDMLLHTHALGRQFTVEQIIKACNAFYRDKLEYEHKRFHKHSRSRPIYEQLLEQKLNQNEFLLRVGRFSGVESVTLDNYRNPRPPGRRKIWGTSRNMAEGVFPMGWVKATLIN